MPYNYTPIPTNAPARATTFNAPLGQLDNAIKAQQDITVGPTMFNAAADGFSPGNTPADNDAAMLTAVARIAAAGGGTLGVSVPGVHQVTGCADFTTGKYSGAIRKCGFKLPSHTKVMLDPAVTLQVIQPLESFYSIFVAENVEDVELIGGTLIGDLTNAAAAEWGYGLFCLGADRVRVTGTLIQDFLGDGIRVTNYDDLALSGSFDLFGVVCDNNNRNGMSVQSCSHLHASGCQFINTDGRSPQSGLDLETALTTDVIQNVSLVGCKFNNNTGIGLLIQIIIAGSIGDTIGAALCEANANGTDGFQMNGTNGTATGIAFLGNHIWGNGIGNPLTMGSQGNGINAGPAVDVEISNNSVHNNAKHGISLYSIADAICHGNRLSSNGWLTDATYDGININMAHGASVIGNIVKKGALANLPRYGINVLAGTTKANVSLNTLIASGKTGDLNDAGTSTIKEHNQT